MARTADGDELVEAGRVVAVPAHWLRPFALDIATAAAQPCTMVCIVASIAGEGSTTIVVNLARIIEEELHRRVVVVDANLAAPALHAQYGVAPAPGLAEVLRGEAALRDAVRVAAEGNGVGPGSFAVLPAGRATAREQSVLLADARLPGLLAQLRREPFDICLVDCPAVLAAPEAAIVARLAETTYCVVRAERTRRQVVEKSVARLRGAGCNLGGVILNRALFHVPQFLYRLL